MLSPLAPWPWAKRQELTISVKVSASSTRPTCAGHFTQRNTLRFFTVLPPALLGGEGKPHGNREGTNSPKRCSEVRSLESAAKAAATPHGTGKGSVLARRQGVRFPKEGLKGCSRLAWIRWEAAFGGPSGRSRVGAWEQRRGHVRLSAPANVGLRNPTRGVQHPPFRAVSRSWGAGDVRQHPIKWPWPGLPGEAAFPRRRVFTKTTR